VPALRTVLFVPALAAGLWAQGADKPLTNSEIESMLAAGLPESTIVIKIEIAVDRGLVDLDASSAALAELRLKGATEPELNAVLWAEPFGALWKQKQEEARAIPGLPDHAGVFFKTQSGWAGLAPLMLWKPFLAAPGWYHGRHESSVVIGAAHADLQIREPQPTFYVRQPASGDPWRIVRVGEGNGQRLLRVSSHGDFGQTVRTQTDQARDIQMTRVAGEIFTLRPTASLDAGEYLLCTTVPGGSDLNLCYGFGVQR
jgi:hypothetical protein